MSALRFAVIGSPVAHSASPPMHEAAFRALRMPHSYAALETGSDELPVRIDALRAGTFAGLNVTLPYKTRVLAFVDAMAPSAAATQAANTLVRTPEGAVWAHNTDAPALRAELTRLAGGAERFQGRTALVLGSGGAARAAVFALGELGVARVVVRARTLREDLRAVLAATAPSAKLDFETFEAPRAESPDLVAVVQTTTLGMQGVGRGALVADVVRWSTVPSDALVHDVVYAPPHSELLARAQAHALVNAAGEGMLVEQGALAFELWLSRRPPVDVMVHALRRALDSRASQTA